MQIIYISFALTIFCIFFHLFPAEWKNYFLLSANLLILAIFSFEGLLFFILLAIIFFYISLKLKKNKIKNLFVISLFVLIGILVFFKCSNILSFNFISLSNVPVKSSILLYVPIGLSYFIFRLIHYLIEVYRGRIENKSLLIFLNYLFFFPTFIAGPIERFQSFYTQTNSLNIFKINLSIINKGLYRILLGMLKKFILADSLIRYIMPIFNSPSEQHEVFLLGSILLLSLHLYLDFSGYTDMAIGLSRLLGYKIIENFNKPFLQTNIAMFWRNWHISVYEFIRDYFFFPIFGYKTSKTKIYLGLFLSMFLFNIWHKFDISFILLGFYHGFGIVIWYFFQEMKQKSPHIKTFLSYKFLTPFYIFSTYTYISFGFLFFYFDFDNALNIIKCIFK